MPNKDKIKGNVNEAIGKATNDEKKELKGKAQQKKGEAKEKADKLSDDAAKKVNDLSEDNR